MTAREIYSWIADLPIVDWHNHLDWKMIAADSPLGSLYEVWVKTDPYKHRVMRIFGEPEELITGDASVAPEEAKWAAWMRTLPKLLANPVFDWAQRELAFLGLDAKPYLHGQGKNLPLVQWTPVKMLKKFRVEWMSPCVTNLNAGDRTVQAPFAVVPSLRLNAGNVVSDETRVRFAAAGCRVVDISVDDGSLLAQQFDSLHDIAAFAAKRGWTMLLHLGALRETSTRLRVAAGPAGGFAGMRAPVDPVEVARFLNRLEEERALPRTILLSLNPEAHAQLAVLAGSFNETGIPGKVQLGPAWWWCDHEEGIRDVLEKNAAYGVLSTFVGMTTDSRSLLSFVRHDSFRRLLARWMAEKVDSGVIPDDEALVRPLCEKIAYRNARQFIVGPQEVGCAS